MNDILLARDELFWLSDGDIIRTPRTLGASHVLAPGIADPYRRNVLASDGTYLYFLDTANAIARVPIDESADPAAVTSDRIAYDLTVAGEYLYFSEPGTRDDLNNHNGDGRITRMQLDTLELEPVAVTAGGPYPLAVDARHVYWLEADALNRSVELWYAPIDGAETSARLLTSDLMTFDLPSVKVAEGHVYWLGRCAVGTAGLSEELILRIEAPR